MWKICFVVVVATVLVSSLAHAQGAAPGPYPGAYIGPQLGIFSAKDADNAKLMGGAALRLQLSPGLGVEGSINYRQEEFAHGKVTVTSWPVMLTGLLYPFPVLYGAIGMGWYNTTFDYDAGRIGMDIASQTKQLFGWHFGGGVDVPLGRSAKFVGDIRYVFLNYNFEQFPGSSGLSANFYVITLGLLIGI